MKNSFKLLFLALLCFTALTSRAVSYSYVGSWEVYNNAAPSWSAHGATGPLAYTGQEAAAKLFGGVASDYAISTRGADVANINFSAWYDVIGLGGRIFSESYFSKYLGQYYGPTSGYFDGNLLDNAASAFVRDNLQNRNAFNFAFRIVDDARVPDTTASIGLLASVLFAFAVVRRKLTR